MTNIWKTFVYSTFLSSGQQYQWIPAKIDFAHPPIYRPGLCRATTPAWGGSEVDFKKTYKKLIEDLVSAERLWTASILISLKVEQCSGKVFYWTGFSSLPAFFKMDSFYKDLGQAPTFWSVSGVSIWYWTSDWPKFLRKIQFAFPALYLLIGGLMLIIPAYWLAQLLILDSREYQTEKERSGRCSFGDAKEIFLRLERMQENQLRK